MSNGSHRTHAQRNTQTKRHAVDQTTRTTPTRARALGERSMANERRFLSPAGKKKGPSGGGPAGARLHAPCRESRQPTNWMDDGPTTLTVDEIHVTSQTLAGTRGQRRRRQQRRRRRRRQQQQRQETTNCTSSTSSSVSKRPSGGDE